MMSDPPASEWMNGREDTMADPNIDNLYGDVTYRSGQTHFIDQGSDAVVTDSDNDLKRLEVVFWWGEDDSGLGIHTEDGGISLSNGLANGSIVSVGTTQIGVIEIVPDGSGFSVVFNENATPILVEELVRALTYRSSSPPAAFTINNDIAIILRDKNNGESASFVSIADRVSGTGDNDTFTVVTSVINRGDELDGGGGNDMFELVDGGIFDLHHMGNITGIETIAGSAGNDFITIRGSHLSGVRRIEGGGTLSGDTLTITETAIDLSNTIIDGFQSIVLADDGAVITLDDVATAKLVTGYDSDNDTLRLTSGTLTALERQNLHRQGIDTIIAKDANGQEVSTTHRAPQITAFDGETINAPVGATVFLDGGRDAVLTSDSGLLKSLSVHVIGISDYVEQIGLQVGDGVTLSHAPGPRPSVIVDGIRIGDVSGLRTPSISFHFTEDATTARVQKLIHALTYTKITGTTAEPRKIEMYLKDVGGREMKATVSVNQIANTAPIDIGLNNHSVKELAPVDDLIGQLSAVDMPGDTFTYQLIDSAGGRFGIDGSQLKVSKGTLLDYEQNTSHTIRVRVTDQGGLSHEKSFVISVRDVARENAAGTSGHDVFVGGSGADKFDGGYGNDRLTGGKGKDTFVFKSTLSKTKNVDTITDFNPKDDAIQLENKIFRKLAKTGTLKKDFFTIGSKAKDGNDHIVYDKAKGCLYYDADGSGKGKAVLFAKLKAGIDHKDFFVI
jgi:serralysin